MRAPTWPDRLVALVLLVRMPILVGLLAWMGRGRSFSESVDALFGAMGMRLDWHPIGKVFLTTTVGARVTVPALVAMVVLLLLSCVLAGWSRRGPRLSGALRALQYVCLFVLLAFVFSYFALEPATFAVLSFNLLVLMHLNSDFFAASHLETLPSRPVACGLLLFPGVAEFLFPVLFARTVLRGLGLGEVSLHRVGRLLQVLYLCAFLPLVLWLGLCCHCAEALQFKALGDYAALPPPPGCRVILDSFAHGDIYQILIDAPSDRIFVNGSQKKTVVSLALARPGPAETVITTGVRFYDIAFHGPTGEIFYFDHMTNRVVAVKVDGEQGRARRVSDPVFQRFEELAFINLESERGRLQVICFGTTAKAGGATLVEFDLASLRKTRAVADLGPPCREILFDRVRHRMYVSFDFKSGVKVIDLDTLQQVGVLDVNNHDGQMALSQSTREVFMADASRGTLTSFDADTLALRRTIHVAPGVRSVAVDEERGIILANSMLTARVYLFDLASGRLIRSQGGFFPKFRSIRVVPGGGRALIGTWNFLYDMTYGSGRDE